MGIDYTTQSSSQGLAEASASAEELGLVRQKQERHTFRGSSHESRELRKKLENMVPGTRVTRSAVHLMAQRAKLLLLASISAALAFLVLAVSQAVFESPSPSIVATLIGVVIGAILAIVAVAGSWRSSARLRERELGRFESSN